MTLCLLPLVQTHAGHHGPLSSHCYIQNVTTTFDMFFCWHLFSLLFHLNKVLWDPGILRPPLLYSFWKGPKLTARLSSCFQTCKLSTGGMLKQVEGLVALCLHPYLYELEWTDKIEPEQWNVWFMSWTRPPWCFSLYTMLSCGQIERSLLFS